MGNKSKGVKRPNSESLKPVDKNLKKAKYNNRKQNLPSPPSEDEPLQESEESSDELSISEEDDDLDEVSEKEEEDELDELDDLDDLDEEVAETEEAPQEEDDDEEVFVEEDSPKTVDPNKKSSKEQHSEQRKLLSDRKLQRKSGAQVQDIKKLWEKLRVTKPTPSKQQRDKLCDEIWDLSHDVINDLVLKHDASRVVQTLIKYSSKDRRDKIVNSLKGSFYQLATSAYGKYLLIKILHYGSKESRAVIVNELHGKLRKLMRHKEGAYVVEDLFVLYSSAEQKQQMIREFWGSEYAVFKDSGKDKTVLDVIHESSEKKQLIMQNLYGTIKASVEKGSTGFQILHAAMREYVTVLIDDIDSNDSAIRDFIDLLSEQFSELVHTQEGSEVACTLLALANAKERKGLVKSLKVHKNELIKNEYGNVVLITLFMVVDDTVLTYKSFGSEMFTPELLPELIENKFSRRPILYILKGLDGRYFAPNVKKALIRYEKLAYQKTSKKDKNTRRQELLEKSIEPIYKALLSTEDFESLLTKNMAIQSITELINTPTTNEKVNKTYRPQLIQKIFDKTIKGDVLEDYHLLNKIPFVSRSIKSLIQGNTYKFDNDSKKVIEIEDAELIPGTGVEFAEKLVDEVIDNVKLNDWIIGQPAFVLVNALEVLQLADSKKAKILKDQLKKQKKNLSKDDKGSKLLLEFI
ncbi:puf6 [Candida pseudojiufengensis]|uniref:puf6 n=1 Tax=Candida pseudojiufengensis TaxID=497109 RepID=UPI0022246E28|nr:puf6 [Candida pseudojiufengensis]KAI5963266.1 puf6 [Candida pseudojiufengensis]